MIQGSPEWIAARIGKLTASRIFDATARTQKGAWTAARKGLMRELVAERLTSKAADHYTSPAMRWGNEHEPAALAAYTFLTGNIVRKVGFVPHPSIKMAGASPDGFVGADGGVEVKCFIAENHIECLLTGADEPGFIPLEHIPQMQWGMACTGRAWWDFVSYDPRMPPHLSVYTARLIRDGEVDKAVAELESDARDFLTELDRRVAKLTALYSA